ncbi:MAG: hypothetical protein JSV19_08505 [Phycisphaerales bacterium]|nr:MAG: hypothetical protein JSV19_08505 [Phycisphaerales bacterium]
MGSDAHAGRRIGHACCSSGAISCGRGISRRSFIGGLGAAAVGGWALGELSWPALAQVSATALAAPKRKPLVVKPVLMYETYTSRPQTSWRSWGGIQTPQDVDAERGKIHGELQALQKMADFPLDVLPLSPVRNAGDVGNMTDAGQADAILVYAAGGWAEILDALAALGKDMIMFVRYKSGPVYLWYEIVHPRFLRAHTDHPAQKGFDFHDVVVDEQEEVLWRLRALCGLKNAIGTRIIAIGGPGGWSQGGARAPELARERFKLDIQTVSYAELGQLLKDARSDEAAVRRARDEAAAYLSAPGVVLETDKAFVENCFVMDQVFHSLLAKAEARAITINACMGTIMPVSETTACLNLTLLNDAGYLAFCESDFVVIPSGILLSAISGRPPFLHNPTYPHKGIITLAHCTAPRKMDGKTLEPARIVTHYESDYGAAPKVEMRKGQQVTIINPDFAAERWLGISGEIVDAPFHPICRSQIDVRFQGDGDRLTEEMRGFHWMLVYGDYLREVGYALKRTPIEWACLA